MDVRKQLSDAFYSVVPILEEARPGPLKRVRVTLSLSSVRCVPTSRLGGIDNIKELGLVQTRLPIVVHQSEPVGFDAKDHVQDTDSKAMRNITAVMSN